MVKKTAMKFITTVCLGSLISLTALQPVSANSTKLSKKETITSVESFIIEAYSDTKNAEGYYVKTGYEVVSAVTKLFVSAGQATDSEISSVTDLYDNDGNYIKTVVQNEAASNDFVTGKATAKNVTTELSEPVNDSSQLMQVINTNDTFEKTILDPSQEIKVSSKIEALVNKLPEGEYQEIQGITLEELNTIKKKIEEKSSRITIMDSTSDSFVDSTLPSNSIEDSTSPSNSIMVSTCPTSGTPGVEACGAYDNYYRHNIVNGDFTVQVLGHAGEDSMYTRLHGNVGTNVQKAQRLATFKQQINTYERYIVDDLEANTFWEVIGWAGALASFAFLVQGFVTGPVGWVAVVTLYSNALITFGSLTSSVYATASRLKISKNAADQLNNAINTHYSMHYNFDGNYGSVYESGF